MPCNTGATPAAVRLFLFEDGTLNGASQKSILVALGVVATVGIFGATASSANAAQILGFASLICVSLLTLLTQIRTAAATAEKVVEVKEALKETANTSDKKIEVLGIVLGKTHDLVNNAMGVKLQKIAVQDRRWAEHTGLQADKEEADLSEKLWEEHKVKQAIVDEKQTRADTGDKNAQRLERG